MKIFSRKGILAAFYYLMTIDGDISAQELEKLNEIREELALDDFADYREAISSEYENRMSAAFDDDDHFDLVLEGIDAALSQEKDELEAGITPRLLIWNMLVMACSDGIYHDKERRIIKHIVRTTGVEKSVFLEMEQLVQTGVAVAKEISWLSASRKPYNEAQPMIAELENRQKVILNEAKALLKDELENSVEALKYDSDFVDEALDTIGKAGTAVADGVGKAVTPVFDMIGNQAGKVFGGLKGLLKKKEEPTDSQAEKNDHAEEGADA